MNFSQLLHMPKGRICIGNYINIVTMILGANHVNFYYLPVLIIARVCRENPATCSISPELGVLYIHCACVFCFEKARGHYIHRYISKSKA